MSASNPGGLPPDLSHLQDNFNEQQAKITALKELVRQSEGQGSSQDAQEKVKSIAQRLNILKSKATKSRMDKSSTDMDAPPVDTPDTSLLMDTSSHSDSMPLNRSRSETPGSEKILLLRQQMELNRRKMAERESSKRDIEVMVSQLKAKFDDTQQTLHRSAELGRSMGDLSSIGGGHGTHDKDNRIRQLEAKVRVLENELAEAGSHHHPRVRELETRIVDLEETIREKDSLIQARTQAVTLMTENMSMKGKNTVDLLEDTQQEMVRMQENFVHEEMSLKDEIEELKQRLTEREAKIANLEEVVDILETTRYDLTVKNAELLNQINDVQDYSSKLEELNLLNQQLQKRIVDLETREDQEEEEEVTSPRILELEREISELKSENEKLKSLADCDLSEKYHELEKSFEEQSRRCAELDEKLTERSVELSVLQASYNVLDERLQSSGPKSLFSSVTADEAEGSEGDAATQSEVLKLKAQLDEANKSQIKTKLKMKQMQKQMDNLKKSSDLNQQVLALQDENQQLRQQLEEVSHQQQQHHDHSDAVIVADDSDISKKIEALEMTCHNQTAAINLLEEQKVDLVDDLHETKAELEQLRAQINAQDFSNVKSEISTIELEEQLELHIQDKAQLTLQVEDLNEKLSALKETVLKLREEKVTMDMENQKLTEKLDKLSEKVSSAESIEILENLTHQEKLEMESQEKARSKLSAEEVEKLRGESELAQKIELFTAERKEVLEKMERVQAENSELVTRIGELEDKERQLLDEREELRGKCVNLEESVATVQLESQKLLSEKVENRLESDSSSAPGTPHKSLPPEVDRDSLRDALRQLENEVESYMKCKDKNGKLATSKKLAKHAKNCVTQFREIVERMEEEAPTVEPQDDAGGLAEEVNRLKELLLESTNVKGDRDQLEEELKSVRVALLEANNAQEDMRGQISVLIGKLAQKDELLEEHETDTAKLLADIKLLQETVQDNATGEEVEALKVVLEKREVELTEARDALKSVQEELSNLSLELSERERRESAWNVERDTMKELIEEQKKQLIEQLMDHEAELTEKLQQIESLEEKLHQVVGEMGLLKAHQPQVEEEVAQKFAEELRFKQETIDTLNAQIMDLYKAMDGNASALLEKEDEIGDLNRVIEENVAQLRTLEDKCAEYENTIQDMETKLREVEEKHSRAANATDDVKIGLEQRIQELEGIVQELDGRNKEQLEKLKKFAANLKKKVAQCNELEKQLKQPNGEGQRKIVALEETIERLREELRMREEDEENKRRIAALEENVERLTEELNQREDEIAQAEATCKEWMRKCQVMESEVAVQQENLQQRAATPPPSPQDEKEELLEKIGQLEDALAETDRHLLDKDATIKEMKASQVELEEKIGQLTETLDVKVKEVEKCKVLIKKRMKEIQELKQQQQSAHGGQGGENFAQEEVIQSLRSQIQDLENYRTQVQMYETKMQENALYIDSLEGEKTQLEVKIQKLEEGIATIEERRNSMEQKVNYLGATLQEKSSEFQEHEDMLVQRLSSLSAHDEVIMGQLASIKQENEDLLESVQEHIKQEHSLQAKITTLDGELQRIREEVVGSLEQEVQQLSYQLSQEAQEKRKSSEDLEKKLQLREKEIEELESEMSSQFVRFEEERKNLQGQHEKLTEDHLAQSEEIVRLRQTIADLEDVQKSMYEELERLRNQCENLSQDDDELKDLRMQIVQDQTEIEHLRAQNLDLSQSHEQELDRLRCEIIRLQENDQIPLLQADVEKFQRELMEKEQEVANMQKKIDEAWTAVEAKNDLIDRLGTKVHDINEKQLTDFNEFSASVNALKAELAEKDNEIANLHGEISRNAQIISELQSRQEREREENVPSGTAEEVEQLKKLIVEKDAEIANYQQRTLQLQMAASMGQQQPNDPFGAFNAAPSQPTENVEDLKNSYESKILAIEETLQSTAARSLALEEDLRNLSEKYSRTQQDLLTRDNDLQSISVKFQETQSLCLQKNAEVERLQQEIHQLEEYLRIEQSKHAVNELVQVAQQHVLSAVPTHEEEEVLVQSSSEAVGCPSQVTEKLSTELQNLRDELQRLQFQLTERCLELDMANTKIRDLEAAAAKKEATKVVEKKQVAQVSPQQIPEGAANNNIPAFSTAQFFDTPTANLPSASSFFDQPATTTATAGNSSQGTSIIPQSSATGTADVPDYYEGRVPVEEEMIVPKTAYVCFPDTPTEAMQPDASSMTPNVDDSWGWNAEEAILEEQHQRMNYQAPPVTEHRVQQLEDKIQELELERDRQRNEIHEFQLKSAKMLKKLKEYKAANETLQRQKSQQSDANDMDQFIQDELREQVRVLEARLREDAERMEKEGAESRALSAKMAQLMASNQKLQEAKGTHELEIERHLTEIRMLRSELQKMSDWDEGGDSGTKKNRDEEERVKSVAGESAGVSDAAAVKELERKVNDLAADNDELQAMLEDEKETNRKLEERLRRFTESQNADSQEAQMRVEELERQLKEAMEFIDKLTKDSQDIKVHLERLGGEHSEKINENARLQQQLQELASKNEEFASLLQQQQHQQESQGGLDGENRAMDLELRLQELQAELEYKSSDNGQMREKIGSLQEALDVAEENLRAKERIIGDLRENVNRLEERLREVEEKKKEEEIIPEESSEDFQKLYEELKLEKVAMEHELQVLNDQVMASLEFEDKMKATVLEMDLKQIEIQQLKATIEQLRTVAKEEPQQQQSVENAQGAAVAARNEEVEQLRGQIEQLNQYWAEAVEKRGNDIAESWKSHVEAVQQDYEARIDGLEQQLQGLFAKIQELEAMKAMTTTTAVEEIPAVAILPLDDAREETPVAGGDDVAAMKAALESQEMEIVTLKEQLAIRSAEFAALSAKLDPYGYKATSNMASVQPKLNKSPAVGGGQAANAPVAGTSAAKKRGESELDLALYMLHQRDMRCEELTHELLILLEERDTLQLKWSDCMRRLETVKRTEGGSGTTSGESSENNTPEKQAGGGGQEAEGVAELDAK